MPKSEAEFIREAARNIPVYKKVDVVVAGSGSAGLAATVCAARNGADVLLVERNSFLGGQSTASFQVWFGGATDILTGFSKEMAERLDDMGAAGLLERYRTQTPETGIMPLSYHITIDPEVWKFIAYDMVEESGAKMITNTWAVDAIVKNREIQGIIIENKSGRQAIYGKVTVDASGDADVAHCAGAPVKYPGGDSCTMMFEMGNVDLQKTYMYYKQHTEDFAEELDIATPFCEFERNWLERGIFHLPHGGGVKNALLQKAIKEGRYRKEKGLAHGLDVLGLFGTRGTGRVLVNSNYFSIDALNDVEKASFLLSPRSIRRLNISSAHALFRLKVSSWK